MTFTLTAAHLDSLLAPRREGNLGPLFDAFDPACEIRMGASDEPGDGGAGVYTVESFSEKVMGWVHVVCGEGQLKFEVVAADVFGNKSIHEEIAHGKMANGGEYVNRNCYVMQFGPETGMITQLKMYTDTEYKLKVRRDHGLI